MTTSASSPSAQDRFRRALHRLVFSWRGAGHPVPPAALDSEYASGRWDHFFSLQEAPRYAAIAELIGASASEDTCILDVGCGSGRLASLLSETPYRTYLGVDFSSEALRRARALGLPRTQFVRGDFEQWRPTEPWDIVVFNESIGYAHWPAQVLGDFARWLTPHGRIIVSHYRAGNFAAIWQQVERKLVVVAAEEITGPSGHVWDIKVLVPRSHS